MAGEWEPPAHTHTHTRARQHRAGGGDARACGDRSAGGGDESASGGDDDSSLLISAPHGRKRGSTEVARARLP